jgi:hypothetical protein
MKLRRDRTFVEIASFECVIRAELGPNIVRSSTCWRVKLGIDRLCSIRAFAPLTGYFNN